MSANAKNWRYRTGPAGLFAVMARDPSPSAESTPPLRMEKPVIITCTWCLSDDTEMVDHEHDIYRCRNCGETFIRRPSG